MGKSKDLSLKKPTTLPIAPWIYVNDSTPDGAYAYKIAALIPQTVQIALSRTSVSTPQLLSTIRSENYRHTVAVISDRKQDHENCLKLKTTKALREGAIKHGCNFVSVNIVNDSTSSVPETDKFGTNHLNVYAHEDNIPQKVYRWLFSTLTVLEHLHLIPEEQMKATDKKYFPDYEYCPINECHLRPKNAKIQFVALVLTKPEIGKGQRLTWTVADRSGSASFYFQYRGPESQYTWDWVLALKPGDRKALPRMPMVQIKENKCATIVKAPFRVTGAVISGTGFVIKSVGKGICKVGHAVKLGQRSEWVPEADVDANGKKITFADDGDIKFVPPVEKTQIKIFNEKGGKTWSDNDSDASTQAGSLLDEKNVKEFL